MSTEGTLSLSDRVIGHVTDVTFLPDGVIHSTLHLKPFEPLSVINARFDPDDDYVSIEPDEDVPYDKYGWNGRVPRSIIIDPMAPGRVRAGWFMHAARVPAHLLEPQTFGLWSIERIPMVTASQRFLIGGLTQTVLRRTSMATLHLEKGDIVMEDSRQELRKHLPIWLKARGRVLITGLGLGCVVRGLLASPSVEHIDVVELDPSILRIVGAEFKDNPRITLHHDDALKIRWPRGTRWDFAWHDLWVDGDHLQSLHIRLMAKYLDRVDLQGAWGLPRLYRQILQRHVLLDREHLKGRLLFG